MEHVDREQGDGDRTGLQAHQRRRLGEPQPMEVATWRVGGRERASDHGHTSAKDARPTSLTSVYGLASRPRPRAIVAGLTVA